MLSRRLAEKIHNKLKNKKDSGEVLTVKDVQVAIDEAISVVDALYKDKSEKVRQEMVSRIKGALSGIAQTIFIELENMGDTDAAKPEATTQPKDRTCTTS